MIRWMKNIEKKLDRCSEDINHIKENQLKSHLNWKEHMKRTNNIEELLLPFYHESKSKERAFSIIGKWTTGFCGVLGALAGVYKALVWIGVL